MMRSMQALETLDLLYRKNPQSTRLGRSILETGTRLLSRHGLEWLTFRKLAQEMDSTEASVYRYFHNKHQLLAYLVHQYGQRLLQQLRATPPSHLDPVPELLKQIFPDRENTDHARGLLPIFWGWYAAHEPGEHDYASLALAPFDEIISHVTQHLGILGTHLSARELAYLLCGSSLLALMPGFSHQAEVYRELWDHMLAGLVRTTQPTQATPFPQPPGPSEEADSPEEAEPFETEEPEARTEEWLPSAPPESETALDLLPEEVPVCLSSPVLQTPITHVMVRKFGGYNLLERAEFENMPLAERLDLKQKKRLQFLSEQGEPIAPLEHAEAIEILFKP